MRLQRSFRLVKLTRVMSLALLSCALAAPAAYAAPKKEAKKSAASAPAKRAIKESGAKTRAAAEPKTRVAKAKPEKASAATASRKGGRAVAKADKAEKAGGKKRLAKTAAAGAAQPLPAAADRAGAAAGGQPGQHGRGKLAAAQGGGTRPVSARLLRPDTGPALNGQRLGASDPHKKKGPSGPFAFFRHHASG